MSATDPAFATQPSTFVPPSTSTSATQTSSANSSNGTTGSTGNSPAGSELYLFTFLTTLLLLLGVSCAIIIRSLILRRRFRRRVQEAIANGVLIPGLMTEPMPREIGEKPKMWSVWIGNPESGVGTSAAAKTEDVIETPIPMPDTLSKVLPISVTKLDPGSSLKNSSQFPSGRMPSNVGIYGTARNPRFFSRIWPRRPPPPSTNDSPSPSTLEAQTQQGVGSDSTPQISAPSHTSTSNPASNSGHGTSTSPSQLSKNPVQVSLLIAMPSAARSRYEEYISQTNPPKNAESIPQIHVAAPTESTLETKELDAIPTTTDGPESTARAGAEADPKSHRLSESSLAKGKARDDHAHLHSHGGDGVWSHLEEGEIPYMEFGVLEVVLNEQKTLNGGEQELVQKGVSTGDSTSGSGNSSSTVVGAGGGARAQSR